MIHDVTSPAALPGVVERDFDAVAVDSVPVACPIGR